MKHTALKLYCAVMLIAGWSVSCKKDISADLQETGAEALSGIVVPVPPYTWTEMATPGNGTTYPSNRSYRDVFTAAVGDTYYCWVGDAKEKVYKFNKSTLQWAFQYTMNDDHGYLLYEYMTLFTWNSKVYVCFDNFAAPGFKSYDPVSRTTTTLAPFPGSQDSVGTPETFVVGDNGYLFFGGGFGQYWRYNFPTNTWTMLGESPLGKRYDATIVVVGDEVYAGLGWEVGTISGETYRAYKKDWVRFQVDAPGSVTRATFPGSSRGHAKTCVIGDNIYLGFGSKITTLGEPVSYRYFDLWKYNINSNSWGQCTDWPGTQFIVKDGANLYTRTSMFSIGKSAYVVTGGINEFWRYSNQPIITTN